MKKLPLLFILGFVMFLQQETLIAQCCAAGNPLNLTPDMDRNSKQQFQLSLLLRSSLSDTYYNGNEVIDIDYVSNSGFQYIELAVAYGLTDKLSLVLESGYFLSKYERYVNPDFERKNATGLADLNLAARFPLWNKPSALFKINATAGIKLPVGAFDVVVDQVKLPIQLQPSSGAFRYHAAVLAAKGLKRGKWNAFGGGGVEISQRIKSKNFDYTYGTVYTMQLGAAVEIHPKISVSLQSRAEIREKSQREDNQIVEASGGIIVMLVPQISLTPFSGWNFQLAFSAPLYRNYNSIQLGNKYSFSCLVSRKNIRLNRS